MSSDNDIQKLNLWNLYNLIDQFAEVADELERISLGFDVGEVDYDRFENALLHLKDCQSQLEEVLVQPTRPNFVR